VSQEHEHEHGKERKGNHTFVDDWLLVFCGNGAKRKGGGRVLVRLSGLWLAVLSAACGTWETKVLTILVG